MSEQNVTLSKNDDDHRFELRDGDKLAGVLDYRGADGAVDFYHTLVDPAFEGRGYGQRLVAFGLADARERGYKVIPSCPFVSRIIDRNPDYLDVKA